MTLFENIGPEKLRAVLTEFYARIFDDQMIGFLFFGKDREQLIQREYEFTARFLGADIPYSGRPIRQAHAASPILGGHFARRLKILKDVMAAQGVDEEVQRVWIEHTNALREQVTRDSPNECRD